MSLSVLAGLVTAPYATPATTDPLRTITERFVAPCCWREILAVHQSPDAENMRAEIVQLVAAGRTEDEIVERYVAQYGERILREPRGAGFMVLILTPLTALLASAVWLLLYLAHRRRATLPAIASAVLPAIRENELEC